MIKSNILIKVLKKLLLIPSYVIAIIAFIIIIIPILLMERIVAWEEEDNID